MAEVILNKQTIVRIAVLCLLSYGYTIVGWAQPSFKYHVFRKGKLLGANQGLYEANDGTVYAFNGSTRKIYRFNEVRQDFDEVSCNNCPTILALAATNDESLLLATGFEGLLELNPSGDLKKLLDGTINHVVYTRDGRAITVDQENMLHVYSGTAWSIFDPTDFGVPVGFTYHLAADTSGIAWLGTDQGLLRFDGKSIARIAGLDYDDVLRVTVPANQTVWVNTFAGLPAYYDGTVFHHLSTRYPATLQSLTDLAVTSDGAMWAIGRHEMYYDDFSGSQAKPMDYGEINLLNPFMRRIMIDRHDRIWFSGDLDLIIQVALDQTTALRAYQALPLSISPNPAQDRIRWTIDQPQTPGATADLQVTNMMGQMIIRRSVELSQGEISLSGWVAGLYQIQLRRGNDTWIDRVLVNP